MKHLSNTYYNRLTSACVFGAIAGAMLFDRGGNLQIIGLSVAVVSGLVALGANFCTTEEATMTDACVEVVEEIDHLVPRTSSAVLMSSVAAWTHAAQQPNIILGGRRAGRGWELEALCTELPSTQFAREITDLVNAFSGSELRVVFTHQGTVATVKASKRRQPPRLFELEDVFISPSLIQSGRRHAS